jgi:hypothetical protein
MMRRAVPGDSGALVPAVGRALAAVAVVAAGAAAAAAAVAVAAAAAAMTAQPAAAQDPAALLTPAERDSLAMLERAQTAMHRYVIGVRLASGPAHLAIRHTRPEIISTLEVAGSALPGDDWITGHRIGLQVKEGNLNRALDLALDCRAADWWCAALLGFVLHEMADHPGAERAFDRALDRMPWGIRCSWIEETGQLLERWGASAFRGMSCERATDEAERLWWLANPFFMEPGNDRRTEHMARLVQLRLHDQTLALHDQRCAPEHRWALLTLGFPPSRWSYERPFQPFERGPGLSFVPRSDVLANPFDSRPDDWRTRPEHRQERYRLQRWTEVVDLPGQVAFFRRDGGLAVAAASSLESHDLASAKGLRMALALSAGPGTEPSILAFERPGAHALFRTTLPDEPWIVSLEALPGEEEGGPAGRTRFGHALPRAGASGLALSDPLLFAWEEGIPETLESVAPRMLGTTELEAGAGVGVFWEIYGVGPDTPVDVSLAAAPDDPGFFRRLGELLRVVERREAIRFTWSESGVDAGVAGRALRLDLSQLPQGGYTLQLTARGLGDEVTTARRIEIVGDAGGAPSDERGLR